MPIQNNATRLTKKPPSVRNLWERNIKSAVYKPKLAISQCLLGDAVRYDGQIQYHPLLTEYFHRHFTLIAICPEVEIGLGVPRPAVELTGDPIHPRMTGRDDSRLDISQTMQIYCQQKPQQLSGINGYIFKSRSPSCGLHDTPVFQHKKEVSRGAGLFTRAIQSHFTNLPLSDEKQLNTETALQQFSQRVLHYYQQQRNKNT